MPAAQLTTDASLTQLGGPEGDASGEATPMSLSAGCRDDAPNKTTDDRFRRSRIRKKLELASLLSEAAGLERALQEMQQRKLKLPSSVWQLTAIRQRQQRIEAELLNAQLKTTLQTIVKQTRLLMSMLTFPKDVTPLVNQKRPRWRPLHQEMADVLELNALHLAVELLEMQIEPTLQRFPLHSQTLSSQREEADCGLTVESMDSRLLPYDVPTVNTGVWQFVAHDDPQCDSNESTVSRIYTMEIVSGSFCVSYKGTYLYRRRVASEGRFVITWASSWTPTTSLDAFDVDFETHESFRREGFVVISPSSRDAFTSHVQTFVCVERDACGVPGCNRGAWAHSTAEDAEQNVRLCVAGEIKNFTEGVENGILCKEADDDGRRDRETGARQRVTVEIV